MQHSNEYQRAVEALESYGVFASGTLGRSMRPLLREGRDVVFVKKTTAPPKKYDVVLYGRGTKCVLHRVIGREGDLCLIRGDNTYTLERIPDAQILGILMEFDRGGKHHTVDERAYRIYSVLWTAVYPLRWSFFRLKSIVTRLFRKLFPKKR